LSAFSSELGVVLAVERMLGVEVPIRATIAVLPQMLPGWCVIADMVAILGSMFFVVGDIDK